MADPTIDTINAMTAQLRAASVLLAELSADVASLREQLPRGGGGLQAFPQLPDLLSQRLDLLDR